MKQQIIIEEYRPEKCKGNCSMLHVQTARITQTKGRLFSLTQGTDEILMTKKIL